MLRFLIFVGLVSFAFVVFSQNKTIATITSSDEDDVVCSSELTSNPVVLRGSNVQFPEAPFNERADWIDVDGALGVSGEVYTTASLTIDQSLPAGEYEFIYTVFNDQYPNSSADLYTLTVNDAPDQPIIVGPSEVCEVTAANYFVKSVDNSLSYTWEVVSGEAVISDGKDSSATNVKFDRNVATSGAIGQSVTIGLKANNQCGTSVKAIQEVQINLKPRKADYVGTELVYESGITSFCETEVSEQTLKLNATANYHNRYHWYFNYTQLDSSTVNTYDLSEGEIEPLQNGDEFVAFVVLGNACGYNDVFFVNETPFVEKQNFSISASVLEKEIITDLPYNTYPVCDIGSLFDLKVESENEKAVQNLLVDLYVYYSGDTTSFSSLNEDELTVSSITYDGSNQLIVKASIDSSVSCFNNFSNSDTLRFVNYEFEDFSILASQEELCEDKGALELWLSSEQLTDVNGYTKVKNIEWKLPNGKTITDTNKIALNKSEQSGKVKVTLQNQYNCSDITDSLDVLIYERLVPELSLSGANDICTEEEVQYEFSVLQYNISYEWKLEGGLILEGEADNSVLVELGNKESFDLLLKTIDDNGCVYDFRYVLNSNCDPFLSLNEGTFDSQLTLYPNPFTTSFNLTGIQDFQKIEVYNISGQLVESYTSKNDLGEALPKGTYLVKIHTSQGIEVQKLLKH